MPQSKNQLDEYLLAAYLSRDLPNRLRSEISAYLVEDDGARDLLTMASDAMDTVSEGDGAVHAVEAPSIQRTVVTEPTQSPTDQILWKLIIVVSVTVLLLTVALAWHIVNDRTVPAQALDARTESLHLDWPEVNDAAAYRVVWLEALDADGTVIQRSESLRVEP